MDGPSVSRPSGCFLFLLLMCGFIYECMCVCIAPCQSISPLNSLWSKEKQGFETTLNSMLQGIGSVYPSWRDQRRCEACDGKLYLMSDTKAKHRELSDLTLLLSISLLFSFCDFGFVAFSPSFPRILRNRQRGIPLFFFRGS